MNPVVRARLGKAFLAAVVIAVMMFMLFPIFAAAKFGFTLPGKGWTWQSFRDVLHDTSISPGLKTTLWLSMRLAFFTTVLLMVLMVPTMTWLHLKAPRWRPMAETASILPYVVPPIALVVGVTSAFRTSIPDLVFSDWGLIPFYMILGLPFTYRLLDAGLLAIDLRTLTEASRGLGAGELKTLWRVVLPNIRTSVISAAFITIAVVLGEYTIAALLLKNTFSVFLVQIGGGYAQGSVALSVAAIGFTWLLLGILALVTRRRGGRPASTAAVGVGAAPVKP
jgi:putative spermidine/putrescine transport system permease protein